MSMRTQDGACRSDFSLKASIAENLAEVACMSSVDANTILSQFPRYRGAQDDPLSTFWVDEARLMLRALREIEVERIETYPDQYETIH
ncbi:hypothetical protein ACYPKM_02665 [Pseudomonas aeruginosa]